MQPMGWVSWSGLGLAVATLSVLFASAFGQPAMAAPGYWRFTGYSVSPPQSQLDATDRATRAMGRASETRVTGAFQPASSGAGTVDLYLKNDDVDRRGYLTTLRFSFTTGVEMRTLTPKQKIRFSAGLAMGGNAMSKALPANGSGKISADNGDYFVTTGGAIDQPASGAGDFTVPGGAPGSTLTLHVMAHLGSNGGLTGQMDINYVWVAGAAPQPGPASGATGGSFAGAWNTNQGAMTLSQTGTRVSGSYSQDGGRIDGQVSGGRLTGYWAENGSDQRCPTQRLGTYYWGRIDWVLSADGRRFTGKWSYCSAEPGGSWTGARSGAP